MDVRDEAFVLWRGGIARQIIRIPVAHQNPQNLVLVLSTVVDCGHACGSAAKVSDGSQRISSPMAAPPQLSIFQAARRDRHSVERLL